MSASVAKSVRSFGPAFQGFATFFRSENNSRIHLAATVAAMAIGYALEISAVEWCIIVSQIGFVWAAEVMNTAVERTVDYISLDRNPNAGAIKDLASAAVLVASVTALVTGIIIFVPKLRQQWNF